MRLPSMMLGAAALPRCRAAAPSRECLQRMAASAESPVTRSSDLDGSRLGAADPDQRVGSVARVRCRSVQMDGLPMGIFNRIGWLAELGIARPPPAGKAPMVPATPGRPAWLVAYATQTGVAERLAHTTAVGLREAGVEVELVTFDALSPARMAGRGPLLMIASTSYNGDAPDMAEAFESLHMQAPASLAGLRYGLLALGDRCYSDFCDFGHRLHAWLAASGAQALFAPIEVDDEDPVAVSEWYRRVAQQAAAVSVISQGRDGARASGPPSTC